jgi:hypothetical protein
MISVFAGICRLILKFDDFAPEIVICPENS